jgi:DNA-binding CsgD family transcriptional regulator
VRQPNLEAMTELVGLVYDCAVSTDGWTPLLERATRLFDASGTVFFVHDLRGKVEYSTHWGVPDDAMGEYVRDFAGIDLARDVALALPPGTVTTDESPPADVYRNSSIRNEFRIPWDVPRYAGYDVFRDEHRLAGFAVQASARRAPFGALEAAVLERLLPHLRRAVAMGMVAARVDVQRRGLEDAIEGLAVGVVLVGANGAVHFANRAARGIAARRDGLTIVGDRLHASSPDDDRALQAAIATAVRTAPHARLDGGGALTIRRAAEARPYSVLVNPGAGPDAGSPWRIASAVVVIGDPDAQLVSAAELAQRLYGLTPSEARLALALASGTRLEAYADEHHLAVSTARWTLKHVLRKTGARRQADLVRLLLLGPVAIGTGLRARR